MDVKEIESRFKSLEEKVDSVSKEIERDAHLEFIESLKKYVNKF